MVKSANVDSWSNSSLSCGHHKCAKSLQTSQRLPYRCLVVPVIPNQLYKYVLFSRYLNGPNKIFSILISCPFSIKEYLAKLHYTQNISSKIGYSLGQKLFIKFGNLNVLWMLYFWILIYTLNIIMQTFRQRCEVNSNSWDSWLCLKIGCGAALLKPSVWAEKNC